LALVNVLLLEVHQMSGSLLALVNVLTITARGSPNKWFMFVGIG